MLIQSDRCSAYNLQVASSPPGRYSFRIVSEIARDALRRQVVDYGSEEVRQIVNALDFRIVSSLPRKLKLVLYTPVIEVSSTPDNINRLCPLCAPGFKVTGIDPDTEPQPCRNRRACSKGYVDAMTTDIDLMKLRAQQTLDELFDESLIPFKLSARVVESLGMEECVVRFHDSRLHSIDLSFARGQTFKRQFFEQPFWIELPD